MRQLKHILLLLIALMTVSALNAKMILKFDTRKSAGTTITLPLREILDTVTVDWGDGKTDNYTISGNHDHTYVAEGEYTVKISGALTWFGVQYSGYNNDKLIAVTSWGSLPLRSLFGAFKNASNLTKVPHNLPPAVTDVRSMFYDASSFNGDLSSWNVSNVRNMNSMFVYATSFNGDISGWNVSKVMDMGYMFYGANKFNGDISGWNVSNVNNMGYMFYGANKFNQNLGTWNLKSVKHDNSSYFSLISMFDNSAMSCQNYDATLIGWANNPNTPNNLELGAKGVKYSSQAAVNARKKLTVNKGWKISNDTHDADCATIHVTGVTLNKTTVAFVIGQTETLTATVQPTNATNQGVTWSSSNSTVASVDATGKVTANNVGTATITVKTNDGNKAATCSVTVIAVNMSRYITITGKPGIELSDWGIEAAHANTPVKIVNGTQEEIVLVGTKSYDKPIKFETSTLTIYGDVTTLYCFDNEENITGIDVSHNTGLKKIWCHYNSLSSLDVSKNIALEELECGGNNLSSLDVSKNTNLKRLYCWGEDGKLKLSSLDVSKNINLESLNCSFQSLTSLDFSNNTKLREIECSNNALSVLDISNNIKLEFLSIRNNNFTTQAIDNIYCALPDRTSESKKGNLQLISSDTPESQKVIVLASNINNATDKNWETHQSGFTGTYVCGGAEVNMSRYITLTVKKGEALDLSFKAAKPNTPIKVVNGSVEENIVVGTELEYRGMETKGTTMTFYGDLTGFEVFENYENVTALNISNNAELMELNCSYNNITALDISKNTKLTNLNCGDNPLTALDISKNTKLEVLRCYSNQLKTLDVSKNTELTELGCSSNQLKALDISKNTKLKNLYCSSNQLSTLDISKNTALTTLNCQSNQLSTLDISKNTKLENLWCYSNKFTTQVIDDIYCALPDRSGKEAGKAYLLSNSSDANSATVLATTAANATAKNWKVKYHKDNSDITGFTGTYVCGSITEVDNVEQSGSIALYPNPVENMLYMKSDNAVERIAIYTVTGEAVKEAVNTDKINTSTLLPAIYIVKVQTAQGNTVRRIVKK